MLCWRVAHPNIATVASCAVRARVILIDASVAIAIKRASLFGGSGVGFRPFLDAGKDCIFAPPVRMEIGSDAVEWTVSQGNLNGDESDYQLAIARVVKRIAVFMLEDGVRSDRERQ